MERDKIIAYLIGQQEACKLIKSRKRMLFGQMTLDMIARVYPNVVEYILMDGESRAITECLALLKRKTP